MRVVDIRLVVPDDIDNTQVQSRLGLGDMALGSVILVDDGFGHLLPSRVPRDWEFRHAPHDPRRAHVERALQEGRTAITDLPEPDPLAEVRTREQQRIEELRPVREPYYIVEHPTRGTLRDLEETESGRTGRFSPTGMRNEEAKCMRFVRLDDAIRGLRQIPRDIALQCDIRCSAYPDSQYRTAWPVVAAGREVIA